jgi:hypothetical protein
MSGRATFILLHPWGPWHSAAEWAYREGITTAMYVAGIELVLPQSDRMYCNWRPEDSEVVVDHINADSDGPIVVGGFSDGARLALIAGSRYADGIVFHSGLWRPGDFPLKKDFVPIVCCGGIRDWTAKPPIPKRLRTDPDGLSKHFGCPMHWHDGGHCWGGPSITKVVLDFIGDLA